MKILLVEDHPGMRLGLRTVFEVEGDIEVVGEAEGADEALGCVEEFAPDVVVMDLQLKGERSGVEVCREIKRLPAPPRVVVYTVYNSEEEVFSCRLSGAESYVHKGEDFARLLEAVRETHAGKKVWFEGDGTDGTAPRDPFAAKKALLTPKQRDVFDLVAQGHSNPRIAKELSVSLPTVKTHVSAILKRLGVTSRREIS